MSTIECVADWCKKFAINLKNSNIQPTEEQSEIDKLINGNRKLALKHEELSNDYINIQQQLSDLNDKYQKVLNLACPLLNKLKEKGEPIELYAITDIINKDKIK
jgi:predicted nuclease with TOPRIM domain